MKVRLQRFMADCGVASRRKAEEMIADGRVRVNGEIRIDAPVMVDTEEDVVTVDDRVVAGVVSPQPELRPQDLVYFLLNKPKGILVTNNDPADRKTVSELMTGVKERVFPVGRLDMDSRGALLMTNDGELANRLTHPRFSVEKTYIVEVEGRISPADAEKMKKGLWLGPEHPGAPSKRSERFKIKLVGRERGRTILEMKITEGKNREIQRVMARLGHPVRDLNRVAIAGKITIRGLEPGEFRPLNPDEIKWLYHVSTKEFHERERSATQAWYENKEMEKERKRLEKEKKNPPQSRPAARSFPPAKAAARRPSARPAIPLKPKPLMRPKMEHVVRHPLGDHARNDD